MNIFRDILKELPESRIEVIPNDENDKQVANQMSDLLNMYKDEAMDELVNQAQEEDES